MVWETLFLFLVSKQNGFYFTPLLLRRQHSVFGSHLSKSFSLSRATIKLEPNILHLFFLIPKYLTSIVANFVRTLLFKCQTLLGTKEQEYNRVDYYYPNIFPVFWPLNQTLVVIPIKMTNYSMQCTLQSRVSKCFLSFCLIQNYKVLTFALPSLAFLCFQIFAMHKRSKLVVLATAPDIVPQITNYGHPMKA